MELLVTRKSLKVVLQGHFSGCPSHKTYTSQNHILSILVNSPTCFGDKLQSSGRQYTKAYVFVLCMLWFMILYKLCAFGGSCEWHCYMLMGEVREVWMCVSCIRQVEGSGFKGWEFWSLRAEDREDGNRWQWWAASESERAVRDYTMA